MGEYLRLKKSNCQNCYKCIRNCPVKSIKFSSNQAHIVTDECILCGECFVVCPQNAKEIRNDIGKAKELIAQGSAIVSIAPSFVANFEGATTATMEKALKKLGFAGVSETAIGATIVKKEYERMIAEKSQSVIISSCCPTVNTMIQKYYPEAIPLIAPVLTPMQAHAKYLKEQNPDCKVVFIGPCIAKKKEADDQVTFVDCVLTFEELQEWLQAENLTVERGEDDTPMSKARLFPITGGILKTMVTDSPDYTYMAVDGIENCKEVITDLLKNRITNCFIEMSSCAGSCVGGPVMGREQRARVKDQIAVERFAGKEDFELKQRPSIEKEYKYIGLNRQYPGQAEIDEILRKMGKTKPEHELNCGACGYNTCREKAVAVYQGKAEISMCMPFLKDKAESFSDTIISNTPNGIIVLNEALEVQQINSAARKILNIRNASDILGDQVIRILDPKEFLDVMESGRSIRDERVYLAEYHRYVEQSIVYDRSYHILMCIMRDVTDEERERHQKEQISKHTIEVTDRVIEKQMRVVQEIASLLGETTAETKIALTNLKDSLNDE